MRWEGVLVYAELGAQQTGDPAYGSIAVWSLAGLGEQSA